MFVIINIKQAGRKHAILDKQKIELDDIGPNPTVKDLITAVVKQQVAAYNAKKPGANALQYLTTDQMEGQAANGKIGFGSIYNEEKADLTKAQETALLAFEDGMYAIFANEEELKHLSDHFDLNPDTIITFIRLTFLAGSIW
ncbi:hypothetical protein [Chitinophaga sancti]|uniref:Uncharacterized protein n=1 Tax=Chitinophaga sancti TaxID=1004 RepID=A0A1K1S105_9BACT|nr:hypothetical protein [Chitinophaga sancti]WQD59747.1 hypothetical protein U0033_17805 [Chitinophaga sancti]WQG88122.1 hypothetical protein SR876_24660 [Chitinophaga sancti]SFW77990.1 hypothetical protein SAMN05661012_04554 [Chitinophaga sancti]